MRLIIQIIGLILLLLTIGLVAFYFIGSSSRLPLEQYKQKVVYGDRPKTYQPGDTLRVITYNLGYLSGMTNNRSVERKKEFFDSNLGRTKDMLRTHAPDLMGLQEVDYGASRSFDVHQADELGTSSSFYAGFHSVNWDKRYVPFPYGSVGNQFGRMLSGQSLLSRFELDNWDHRVLKKPDAAPFYYKAFYLDRLIQVCDWMVGDQVVKVMNLHLEAFDKQTRVEQAHVVVEEYSKYAEAFPVLILGDFNSRAEWLDDDAIRVIMQAPGIASAVTRSDYEADSSAYYTFSSQAPTYMIDYVLYNESFINPVDSRVLSEVGEVSDHLPLLFDFVLNE